MKAIGSFSLILLLAILSASVPVTFGGEIAFKPTTPEQNCEDDGSGGGGSDDDACDGQTTSSGVGDPEGDLCEVVTNPNGGDQELAPHAECGNPAASGVVFTPMYDRHETLVGWEITDSSGVEMLAICGRDFWIDINEIRVRVDRNNSMARIAKIPVGTTLTANRNIEIQLNGSLFSFSTDLGGLNAPQLNALIYDTLRKSRFDVVDTGDFWAIKHDAGGNDVIEARFFTDDPAIVTSAVSIEPANNDNFPYCFPLWTP